MKKIVIAVLALFFVVGGGTAAFASSSGPFEVDASFGFATGPDSFDSGLGLNVGAGYMLSSIDKNLQARVDVSYFDFSKDNGFITLSYTRAPLTVGARYYFPINDQMKAFAQVGLEASIDAHDNFDFLGKHTKNEVNLGITPGGGIEYYVIPEVSLFALGRFHIITDNYFSVEFGAAFHF